MDINISWIYSTYILCAHRGAVLRQTFAYRRPVERHLGSLNTGKRVRKDETACPTMEMFSSRDSPVPYR